MTRAAIRRRAPSAEVPFIPPELDGITQRLVDARQRAGLSVTAAGTTRLERGYRLQKLSAVVAVRLAAKLNVSVGWLLTGEGSPRLPTATSSRGSSHPASIRAEEIDEE